MSFSAFTLAQLPPVPARVLEVGCGESGGVTPDLLERRYDVVAIDPRAPRGPAYRQLSLEQLDDPGPFDAVVCGRVLHHLSPLDEALDRLVALAPLLVVDEFAWNLIDEPARTWYETRRRQLVTEGSEPPGPADLEEWRERHPDLHTIETLRAALDARYRTRIFEPRPYLCRWLGDAESEELEWGLVQAGALPSIGWQWVGERRS